MPRVTLDPAERDITRFSDWVRGELRRQKKKQTDLADAMGITQGTLSLKMAGKTTWTLADYYRAVRYLGGQKGE